LVYIQANENVDCYTESQKIADSIQKSITGFQKEILASTLLTEAYIEVNGTDFDKDAIYDRYYSSGGLQEKDILIEIEFDFVVSGNQDCYVDSPCDDDDFVFSFEAPLTFCEKVNDCLGIDPLGESDYFLNEQGDFVQVSGGGASVIEITQAGLLALIGLGNVENATYQITDISGFEAVYVNGISPNIINSNGCGHAYVPVYVPDTDYKGQYHSELGAVADGEIYTWGEWNYKNESGGALTPDLPTENQFDSLDRFTQLAKSDVNYYTMRNFYCGVRQDVTVNEVSIDLGNGANTIQALDVFNLSLGYTTAEMLCAISKPSTFLNTNVALINNRVLDNGQILGNLCNTFSVVKNCFISAGTLADNTLDQNCLMDNLVEVNGGQILLLSSHFSFNNGGATLGNIRCDNGLFEIQAALIDHQSHILDFTVTGCDFKIQDIDIMRASVISGWTVETDMQIKNGHIYNSQITNFTYDQDMTTYHEEMSVSLENVVADGFTNIPIGGTDIYGNKGCVSVLHIFDDSPLNNGETALYGVIPDSAVVNKIIVSGASSINGTSLDIGVSVDSPSEISFPVAFFSGTNSFDVGIEATGNRSLIITAGGNITTGEVKIKVEFTI